MSGELPYLDDVHRQVRHRSKILLSDTPRKMSLVLLKQIRRLIRSILFDHSKPPTIGQLFCIHKQRHNVFSALCKRTKRSFASNQIVRL